MDKIVNDIIKSAEERFIQFGIRNVSVDNICNDIHISKKTFYKYFPQKEDLIVSVIGYFKECSNTKFCDIYKNKNAIDALVQIIKEVKKAEGKRPHLFIHDLQKYYPEIFNRFKRSKECRLKPILNKIS
ncbi:MAG: helix-turn-helix domain-containing protein [Paludibacteraceae bacterium]